MYKKYLNLPIKNCACHSWSRCNSICQVLFCKHLAALCSHCDRFFVDIQIFKYLKKYSKIVRCDGSLMAHQTSGAEVPGSNPASLTMILMRCRIIVSNCRQSQGREGNLPLRQKQIDKEADRQVNCIQIQIIYRTCTAVFLLQ